MAGSADDDCRSAGLERLGAGVRAAAVPATIVRGAGTLKSSAQTPQRMVCPGMRSGMEFVWSQCGQRILGIVGTPNWRQDEEKPRNAFIEK